ncbi:MAG: hypothetical protein GXO61_04620 [Epsilonproteobacteria bacterium]|nr:hypothetical protein [Campylobacterota bacterium]
MSSFFEKRILALHYNGVYISNFDLQKVASAIGIELDLAQREKMLKSLLKKAKEEGKSEILLQELIELLQRRKKNYLELAYLYPASKEILLNYVNKTDATIEWLKDSII